MNRSFKIVNIDPSELNLIEKNARYMSQTEFNALVSNIKRDGQLTTVPFCVKTEEGLTVVSGNHRVKASIEAGIREIPIMVGDGLSNEEIRAIQLSHNSIVGKDDTQILKELFDEIKSNELKEYSFVDTTLFEELEKIEVDIVQPKNNFISIAFMFFDSELIEFEELLQEINEVTRKNEIVVPFPKEVYDNFLEITTRIKKEYDIKDYGASIIKMAEIAKMAIDRKDTKDTSNKKEE